MSGLSIPTYGKELQEKLNFERLIIVLMGEKSDPNTPEKEVGQYF